MFSQRKEYFSYIFHHSFLKSKLSLMVNFDNFAVSQKYNVHEIIAHFSPILDKKNSAPLRNYFFSVTRPNFDEKCVKISIIVLKKIFKRCFLLKSLKRSQLLANNNLREPDFFFGTEEVIFLKIFTKLFRK